jgi:hypothetical protein
LAPIFISYSRKDKSIALQIDALLRENNFEVWIDHKLKVGEVYEDEIKNRIRQCWAFIVVISQAAADSDYVKREIIQADLFDKPILPVYLEQNVQFTSPLDQKLNCLHHLDWCPSRTGGELLASLRKIRARRRFRTMVIASAGMVGLALLLALGWRMYFSGNHGNHKGPADARDYSANPSTKEGVAGGQQTAADSGSAAPLRVPTAVQLPAEAAQLAALGPLQVAFQESPPENEVPDGLAVKPALEFALFGQRQGEAGFSRMEDGHALKSNRDLYTVVARPQSAGWLYIFQVDSLGNVAWLYPENSSCDFSTGQNPVAAGDVLQMPPAEAGEAFFLDDNVGAEQIFFVFAAGPWPKLEEALRKASQQIGNTPMREALVKLDRGPGGTRKVEAMVVKRQQNQQSFDLQLQGLVHESDGSLLVRQRWFRHVE